MRGSGCGRERRFRLLRRESGLDLDADVDDRELQLDLELVDLDA